MPRKPKNKSDDQDQNMNTRNSEEGSMNKTGRSVSMGDDVEETKYDKENSREEEAGDIDVTDDEDEDESSHRRK